MPEEFISRERTLALLKSLGSRDYRREKGTIQDAIKMISSAEYTPTADVAPVVHGQWCVSKIRSIETVFYCSECKRTVTVGNDFFGEAPKSVSAAYPYCHCGAKMNGGNDDAAD